VPVPQAFREFGAMNYLGGRTLNELMRAEQQATELALAQSGKPNCAIRLPRVNEETVGALLFLLEMQTVYAGELYNIDAFNQPGVELGKNYTYALMGRSGFEAKRRELEKSGKPDARWVVTA
jgi:glucose-6-phosphate isomerase